MFSLAAVEFSLSSFMTFESFILTFKKKKKVKSQFTELQKASWDPNWFLQLLTASLLTFHQPFSTTLAPQELY